MQTTFDPYYRWLGIPPEEQPPNHYRLLGLRLFEADPDVIESAADRQMRHVQTFKTGPHSSQSQALLNEIAAAKVCLLNAARKAEYDAGLKASFSMPPAPPYPTAARPPVAVAIPPAPQTAAAPVAATPDPPASDVVAPIIESSSTSVGELYRAKTRSRWKAIAATAVVVIVFAAAAGTVVMLRPSAPLLPPLSDQRIGEGTQMFVDLRPADHAQRQAGLAYELLAPSPPGVQLDRQTGALSWTPRETDGPGNYRIGVRVSVAGSPHLADEAWFNVAVDEVHQPPQLDRVQLQQAGGAVNAVVRARDMDRPTGKVVLSLRMDPTPTTPPTFNAETGQFSWRPGFEDTGKDYQVVFRAAKAAAADVFSEQRLTLSVPQAPYTHERFAARMKSAGSTVQYLGQAVPPMFGGTLHRYRIDDAETLVTQYPAIEESQAAKDALNFEQGTFGPMRFRVSRPTRFFHKELLLVAYLGENDQTLARLTQEVGSPLGLARPEDTTAQSPQPAPSPETPVTEPPKRISVPDAAAVSGAVARIREIFAEQYKAARRPDEKLELSKTLYAKALESTDDPLARYALFQECIDLAVAAASVQQSWQALEMMAAQFEVDLFDLKLASLRKALGTGRNTAEYHELTQRYGELVELAVQNERFDDALALIQPASTAAARAENGTLNRKIQQRGRELRELRKAFEDARTGRETLKAAPDNAEANLAVGRYLCFWRNRWVEGLPLLAKSGSAKIAAAARLDAALPTAGEAQVKVGDAWMEAAESLRGLEREALIQRAGYWYGLALPQLAGLEKLGLQKKIDKLPPPSDSRLADLAPTIGPVQDAAATTLQPAPTPRPAVPAPAAPRELPPLPEEGDPQAERTIAAIILRFQPSSVHVGVGNTRRTVHHEADLPAEEFQVRGVTLAGSDVGDFIMPYVWRLTHLERLSVAAETQITDAGMAGISALPNLGTVLLTSAKLTDATLAELGKLPRLQNITLDARITDQGLAHLKGMSSLRSLSLRGNRCTDDSFAPLAGLPSLTSLTISSDQVRGSGLAHLAEMTELQTLNLDCLHLEDGHLDEIARCSKLGTLNLRGNFSEQVWSVAGRISFLTSLAVDSPRVTYRGIEQLRGLSHLRVLSLRGSTPPPSDEELAAICRLTSLEHLFIQNCEQITDAGLRQLASLTSLKYLDLYQARKITNNGLAAFTDIPALQRLQLFDAQQVNDEGLKHFRQATNLSLLRLSGSSITSAGIQDLKQFLTRSVISK